MIHLQNIQITSVIHGGVNGQFDVCFNLAGLDSLVLPNWIILKSRIQPPEAQIRENMKSEAGARYGTYRRQFICRLSPFLAASIVAAVSNLPVFRSGLVVPASFNPAALDSESVNQLAKLSSIEVKTND